jgi:hypothetical protein
VYTVFVAPDSLQENVTGQTFRSVYVGTSTDAKDNEPVFTFTDHKVFTGAPGVSAENLFPALAVDGFGHVYAVWSNNTDILYSYSADAGNTWSPAVRVNQGETVGRSNVFPWADADANGHLVIAWYGADRVGSSNDANVMAPCPTDLLGDFASTTCMKDWANWRVYIVESLNAHFSSPAFVQAVASDHVNHRGTISTGGLTGNANRDMGDFFKVALDPQHRANLAHGDDHLLRGANPSDPNNIDNPNASRLIRAYFTRQLQTSPGIITSGQCAGQPPETGQKLRGSGRIAPAVNFALTFKSDPMNGTLQYADSAADVKVQSSNGAQAVEFQGACVTANGDAKVNGAIGYTYHVQACDNGDHGARDTLFIRVTGPNLDYSNSGVLTEGDFKRN